MHAALLGGEQAAMSIHNSPYNVRVNGHVSSSGQHREFVMGSDEMGEPESNAILAGCLRQARGSSKPGAIQFAFMDWRSTGEMLAAGQASELSLKNRFFGVEGALGLPALQSFDRSGGRRNDGLAWRKARLGDISVEKLT